MFENANPYAVIMDDMQDEGGLDIVASLSLKGVPFVACTVLVSRVHDLFVQPQFHKLLGDPETIVVGDKFAKSLQDSYKLVGYGEAAKVCIHNLVTAHKNVSFF